jgi:hypothetical protein
MARNDNERIQSGILGDIKPTESARDRIPRRGEKPTNDAHTNENDESMAGGSTHDRTEHSGSRDVTEGVTGGLGTETGGTRNYRQGTGATGGDIGNRPE